MQKVLSAIEMREVDRLTAARFGVPTLTLMENAATAVFDAIAERAAVVVVRPKVLVLCGKGNNGGDGAALARLLWRDGADVEVRLFGRVDETKGDARVNFDRLAELASDETRDTFLFVEDATFEPRDDLDVVVDALFGTGLTRALDETFARELAAFYARLTAKTLRVAVDIPSGLFSDTGEIAWPETQIGADVTVTFTAPKLANVLPPASNLNGELIVAEIGSPAALIDEQPSAIYVAEESDARDWLRKSRFASASYKNRRGHALVVAGSRDYSGAAVLAGNAAMVSGAGLVTVATAAEAQTPVASRILPEVIVRGVREYDALAPFAEKCDAAVVGCGLTVTDATRALIASLIENRRVPLVLDADALNALAPFEIADGRAAPLILTPHEGEFRRLSGVEAIGDRVVAAREFATGRGVILVLKGERTLIAAPDGRVVVNPTGNPGLGKAGNGDTLAGFIGGCLAQANAMKIDIFETVVAAVYIAGLAGDIAAGKIGTRTMLASDVRRCLADAFRRLEE